MTKMVIGFDAKRIVRNGTGLGSYGRTLVNDLAQQPGLSLRLYAPDAGRDDLRQQVAGQAAVSFSYAPASRLPLAKALWRSRGVVADLVADGVQVYHGLSGELPSGLRRSGVRGVVTIHDLIFLRHPEFYNPVDVWIYTRKFRQALRQADRIVAISACTRRDIAQLGGVPEDSIDLIYQSCAQRFATTAGEAAQQAVRQAYDLPRRFVLSVGTIEARKNILLAVKALRHLPGDVGLVVAGRATKYTRQVSRYAADHGLTARVRLLHGVSDEQLPALYALAESFVYPSRYEGFGIPIIEAIRCGLPVVACTGSCLEEAGGPDSLYVDPDDDEALAAAIRQTLRGAEGRQERIVRSREWVRRFDGNNAAQQFVRLYEELIRPNYI